MMDAADKPELRVTVFSDVICPFCYVGAKRLDHLNDAFDLRVNWCFLEIHPETPPTGMHVSHLGYDSQRRRAIMGVLARLAEEERLVLSGHHDFTTNSRQALLLAEAAKEQGRAVFYALHEALFAAFFRDQQNIGDTVVLERIARQVGMPSETVHRAWTEPLYAEKLKQYHAAAQELSVRATPTFFIGQQRLDGVVSVEQLREAAQAAVSG
jgi:predicted DsbA family dithiol-disulfide isomerase